MSYRIRSAERRDLAALTALAEAQARERKARDPRLPTGAQVVPFLSAGHSLADVLSWRHHSTFVAEQDGVIVGGVNVHRVEQRESDQFATYYPRRFTSIGLLAAHPTAPAHTIADLLKRAHEQAKRWKTPFLLTQNACADQPLHDALCALRFRTYYHYALRQSHAHNSIVSPLVGAGILVRPALTRDLDDIVRLGMDSVYYHASLERTMQVARDEPHKMRERLALAIRDGEHSSVIVAELDGVAVGFYSIYVQQIDDTWTPPLYVSGRYGLIAEVAVNKPLRGKGIARQIFTAVDEWFRARDVDGYWLIYLQHNPLSSRFWPRLGFAPVWEVMLKDEG